MSNSQDSTNHRRKFLKLLSGSVVIIPLAGIQGCAKEPEPAATKAAARPDSKPQTMPPHKEDAKPAAKPAAETPATVGKKLPQLAEDDPQAMALGYKHDASKVDGGKYPRYESGQICKNCALFGAKGDEEWASCSIFPGKSVNTKGWCGVYAPKG